MSKAGNYYAKTYRDEIESFSFSTRNNDGATFSASVPSQTATLVLNVKGDSLIDSTLEKGCYAAITSNAEEAMTIVMVINEITNLKIKGRVEISLGRVTIEDLNVTTHGVYTVDRKQVGDFIAEAGLQGYVFTDMDDQYLSNFVVNSKSVDDTVMAVAWSQKLRRNVTLLPAFSAYPSTSAGEAYRNSHGVMLFQNKDGYSLSQDSLTNVYRVEAEDIYDYTIEAAQPPVTEVKTAGSGLLGPVDADENTVFQYGTGVGTSGSMNTMSGYLLLGQGMTAQLYDRQVYTGDDDDYQIEGQTLVWSNGDRVDFDKDFQPNGIVGVFKDHFLGASMTEDDKLTVYDKELNVVANVDIASYNAYEAFSKSSLLSLPLGPFVPRKFMTYSYYNAQQDAQAEILFFNAPLVSVTGTIVAIGVVHLIDTWTLLTVVTSTWAGLGGLRIRALVPMSTVRNGPPEALMPVYQADDGGAVKAFQVRLTDFDTKDGGNVMPSPLSPSQPARLLRDATMAEVYRGWTSTTPVIAVLFYDMGTNMMKEAITLGSLMSPAANLSLDTAAYMSNYDETYGKTFRKILAYDEYKWQEYYSRGVSTESAPLIDESKRGSTELWADSATVFYSYYREYLAAFVFKGSDYWSLFGQVAENPFSSRMPAQASVLTNIGDGTENAVDLSFKVGNITMDDVDVWDATDGRIELEVAGLYVKGYSTGDWTYGVAERLPLPALSTYLYVALDPEAPLVYTTVKIIGCSIEYAGRVKLKISGMIVG